MNVRVEVYQLEDEMFALQTLNMFSKEMEVDPAHYQKTFETIKPQTDDAYELLGTLYHELNADDRPTRFTSRSLSISDVVIIDEQAFLCHAFGWKPIRFRVKETISI